MTGCWKEGKGLKFHRNQLLIYAVTDRAWTGGRSLCGQVEEALKGGATMVQFREKSLEKKNFDQILGEAKALRELTQRYHVPLIIDDNMDLAEACNADGLHVAIVDYLKQKNYSMASNILKADIEDSTTM